MADEHNTTGAEVALDPELPICDPHHHLWDHPGNRYLLDELLHDTDSGHTVVQTVFVECLSMYRKDGPPELKPVGETEFVQGIAAQSANGPPELKPVGETEFVQGIAAQSASGNYGPMAACTGIVGFADLSLGDGVQAVLEAHLAASPNRFRGIRHAASWHASPDIRNAHTGAPKGLMLETTFRTGLACLHRLGLSLDAWLYHTQLMELVDLARACPAGTIILNHVGGPLGIGPYEGQRAAVFQDWKRGMAELATLPQRRGKTRRSDHADERLWLA